MKKLEGNILCIPFYKKYSTMENLNDIANRGYIEQFYHLWLQDIDDSNYYFVSSVVVQSELLEALYK